MLSPSLGPATFQPRSSSIYSSTFHTAGPIQFLHVPHILPHKTICLKQSSHLDHELITPQDEHARYFWSKNTEPGTRSQTLNFHYPDPVRPIELVCNCCTYNPELPDRVL